MDEAIKKIEEIIKKEASQDDWRMHIKPVVEYSLELAEIYDANRTIIRLSALLHDIGRIRLGPEKHGLTGASEAKIILNAHSFDKTTIEQVVHCVSTHSAKPNNLPESLEAKIISNADCLAHFDAVPYFFYNAGQTESGLSEITDWVSRKINRDWDKLTLPKARDLAEDKYKSILLLLESLKKHL